MDKFSQGWECLLHFVENSILNGSKDLAIIANNCLLSVLLVHCLKGGILLGPSAFGRSDVYMKKIFPKSSIPVLETVANIGILYFLFLVGLELDFQAIKRTRRRALPTAIAGISLLFISGIGIAYILKATVSKNVGIGQCLVYLSVSLSITAFPALARILAELKLLTTDVGQMAMVATAMNDSGGMGSFGPCDFSLKNREEPLGVCLCTTLSNCFWCLPMNFSVELLLLTLYS